MPSTTDTSSPSPIERANPNIIAQLKEEQALLKRVVHSNEFRTQKAFQGGAEGVIHLMVSKSTDTTFIMKLTHARPIKGVLKYPNEVNVLSRLRPHRNIITMLDVVKDKVGKGRYKIWMEHCRGGDFCDQVQHWWQKRRIFVPEPFLLHVIVSLFDGLAFLHYGLRYNEANGQYSEDESHGQIAHGDLKVENVFLRWPTTRQDIGGMPEVVIGDFGAAKAMDRFDTLAPPGTRCYHAPEDVEIYGRAKYSHETLDVFSRMVLLRQASSDIWAAGQVLYQIAAADVKPFPIGESLSALQFMEEYKTPGLQDFIVKCLQNDPAKRGTADFSNGTGLLPTIQTFRAARDQMIAKKPMSDPLDWRLPKHVR